MSRTRNDGQGSRPPAQPTIESISPGPPGGEPKKLPLPTTPTHSTQGSSHAGESGADASNPCGVLADAIRRTLLAAAGEQLEGFVQGLSQTRPDLSGNEPDVALAIVGSILERSTFSRYVLPGTVSWIADELASDPIAADKLQQLWRQSRERNAKA